jgi:hypothetical protein
LAVAFAARSTNELEVEAAQARVSLYVWGAPEDDRGRALEGEAKSKLAALVANRGVLSRGASDAQRAVERCEARLMLIRAAGDGVDTLQATEADYADAARLLDQAACRRDEAAAALATAQNKRQQCVAAAARGEASAGKALKSASTDRDDAADVLEAADLVLEEAQRRASESEAAIYDSVARGLAIKAADLGEERAAISAKMGKLFGDLIQCLGEFEAKGQEAREFVAAARRVPHRLPGLGNSLEAITSNTTPDTRQFLRFLYGRMPNEIRPEIARDDLSPSGMIEDLETVERKIWSALRAA